jgi:hypothetical protein
MIVCRDLLPDLGYRGWPMRSSFADSGVLMWESR